MYMDYTIIISYSYVRDVNFKFLGRQHLDEILVLHIRILALII